jgi:hypothetical protein
VKSAWTQCLDHLFVTMSPICDERCRPGRKSTSRQPRRRWNADSDATAGCHMPREGAIIFRDIAGKLTVLRLECEKCDRSGRYRADRLIERSGTDTKLFD